jgi:hypothetical protein
MRTNDRRYTPRLEMKIPLKFRLMSMPSLPEQVCESANISARGLYFTTALPLDLKTPLEIILEMPEEITGKPPARLCITGQVRRVELPGAMSIHRGIGVMFLCYEAA